MDCASSPALYESSAEYYSNEQKKTHKVTQSLSKAADLQQITDASNIKENTQPMRRVPITPTTTERLARLRQRLQTTSAPSKTQATSRSFHSFAEYNKPTQRTQVTNNAFDKRRKNLVQLIANNFGNTPTARTTLPSYTDSSSYRSSGDYNNAREMQVAAETASFTNNNNRQYLQDYNNKNYRPYPEINSRAGKTKSPHSTLTTLFVHDIRDKHFGNQVTRANYEFTTKRPTLVPYTKSYGNILNEKHEPYTRPGVHLLKDFLDKEKNKTVTEILPQVTERIDQFETNQNFETVTKIPTARSAEGVYFTQPDSSDRYDIYSSTNNFNQITTEPTYHERRERLLKKLSLDTTPTEATYPTTEKQYGRRPGLIVPPSLTPKTLHTLAIYYATALDNLSTTTTPDENGESTTINGQFEDDSLPALFSQHTIDKYSSLFSQAMENSDLLEELKLDPNSTNEISDDLSVQQSQNPLSTSPQIRELAQVFTHALSAYLQDPVQFRKVLSDIRPTHPSFSDMLPTTDEGLTNTELTTTINEEDEEILGFSDENKVKPGLAQLRDPKSLNLVTVQPRVAETATATTPRAFSIESASTTPYATTKSSYRCCGRISASYTSASTQSESVTTPSTFTNTFSARSNFSPNQNETSITTTENSYTVPKYGGFQNNTNELSPYGKGVQHNNYKPLTEYVEVTNLPTAWGTDNDVSPTDIPITNSQFTFESNKIRQPTTTTAQVPTTTQYSTESDSLELENEEELQRAHSQSFVTPQNNNFSQQQIKAVNLEKDIEVNKKLTTIKKPSEELEAPTLPDNYDATTTTQPDITTTDKNEDTQTTTSVPFDLFTSPDSDKTTNQFQWANSFENWHSTVILDPITLNDGLSATGPQQQGLSQFSSQTTAWLPTQTTYSNTATTNGDYVPQVSNRQGENVNEQAVSSSQNIIQTTPANNIHDDKQRNGKSLQYSVTGNPVDLTTIQDTVVEKAKEIMGGMNSTTAEKLMNVMKKTKSNTVRRLILLLVQTCDDDHNSTAEASKKALLEALMAVSQKDMDDIANDDSVTEAATTPADFENNKFTNTHRRMDRVLENNSRPRNSQRSGKSLNVDPNDINALTNPSTTQATRATEIKMEPTTVNTTPSPFSRTTPTSKRGGRKYFTKTTPIESKANAAIVSTESPRFEARVAPNTEQKTPSDTRAIELLRSLYTIAARWG